ncbi:uncharacterized protein ASCRUDRAFT_70164 [Ascoidea rubescens DSM 1968]|uniref:F-box domain-containing protein n=1 Tax=Ascoidea rubescens DSM 1968 TaxID=1344418 RepID=A0A1D2VJC4_9ASCO|nr:hypothetical protein ASCRUDRAFT_70164 [Ascoidea rubescens DSM 1968]ODV61704.1 hypothetical protein ASCRUDRAFT_70164 [Ascoidea rubescens DSM 1968]
MNSRSSRSSSNGRSRGSISALPSEIVLRVLSLLDSHVLITKVLCLNSYFHKLALSILYNKIYLNDYKILSWNSSLHVDPLFYNFAHYSYLKIDYQLLYSDCFNDKLPPRDSIDSIINQKILHHSSLDDKEKMVLYNYKRILNFFSSLKIFISTINKHLSYLSLINTIYFDWNFVSLHDDFDVYLLDLIFSKILIPLSTHNNNTSLLFKNSIIQKAFYDYYNTNYNNVTKSLLTQQIIDSISNNLELKYINDYYIWDTNFSRNFSFFQKFQKKFLSNSLIIKNIDLHFFGTKNFISNLTFIVNSLNLLSNNDNYNDYNYNYNYNYSYYKKKIIFQNVKSLNISIDFDNPQDFTNNPISIKFFQNFIDLSLLKHLTINQWCYHFNQCECIKLWISFINTLKFSKIFNNFNNLLQLNLINLPLSNFQILNDIYTFIFSLPNLKLLKLNYKDFNDQNNLLIINNYNSNYNSLINHLNLNLISLSNLNLSYIDLTLDFHRIFLKNLFTNNLNFDLKNLNFKFFCDCLHCSNFKKKFSPFFDIFQHNRNFLNYICTFIIEILNNLKNSFRSNKMLNLSNYLDHPTPSTNIKYCYFKFNTTHYIKSFKKNHLLSDFYNKFDINLIFKCLSHYYKFFINKLIHYLPNLKIIVLDDLPLIITKNIINTTTNHTNIDNHFQNHLQNHLQNHFDYDLMFNISNDDDWVNTNHDNFDIHQFKKDTDDLYSNFNTQIDHQINE